MNAPHAKLKRSVLFLVFSCLVLPFPARCATTWHVDVAVAVSGDGLTWQTAKKTIQEAVDAASAGDQIWVAEGVYFQHVAVLKAGLSVYGGFSRNETTVGERDLSVHKTILDGSGLSEAEAFLTNGIPDFIVIDGLNIRNSASGLYGGANFYTIRNCSFANNYYSGAWIGFTSGLIENCAFVNNVGSDVAGLRIGASEVCTIRNCVFEGNVSSGWHGAVYLPQAKNLTMSSCVIRNNINQKWGALAAGMYVSAPSFGGPATIDRCVITGNTASGAAGGISYSGDVSITNCLIADNTGYHGGGVNGNGGAISNSIIANNTAYNGGGVWCDGAGFGRATVITNCTIVGNTANGEDRDGGPPGGGIYCQPYISDYTPPYWAYLNVTNTIFAGNSPNAIRYINDAYLTPWNNLFQGNPLAVQGPGGDYVTGAQLNGPLPGTTGRDNLDGNPAFVNAGAENYHLLPNSAAIDRGTTVGLTSDFDGAPRPIDIPGVGADGTGQELDIGAFEYPGPIPPALTGAHDGGGGILGVSWTDDGLTTPSAYLGFAYDVYEGEFVLNTAAAKVRSDAFRRFLAEPPEGGNTNGKKRLKASLRTGETPKGVTTNRETPEGVTTNDVLGSEQGTIWFPFPPKAREGRMDLHQTGAYFAWISSQFVGGAWLACRNPATVILYGGTPHTPANVSIEDRGAGVWRLHWTPELYGTWLDQIIVYQDSAGFIETQGPDGFGLWHFIDYGALAYDPSKASFLNGWADFTLPPGASHVFFLNFLAWDATTQGEFAWAATP